MARNIFPERSQAAAELLARAEPRRVLIVPVDFAKKIHVVQFAKGSGEYLRRRPLNVRNDMEGVQFLLGKIAGCCAKYRIPKGNVLIGGEEVPEYAMNFVLSLELAGYRLVRVNAADAKRQRTNCRATSDALALDGIAQAIRQRRAYDLQAHDALYGALKMAGRARRSLRIQVTATRNRIHKDVELLCPGLLDEKLSGLPAFGPGVLALMESGCSVQRLRRMSCAVLARHLARTGTRRPDEVAAKLKAFAAGALPPDPGLIAYRQGTLTRKVGLLKALTAALADEEEEMARCLVRTPAFVLTSIPGLGVALAGGIVGEYGDPQRWRDPDRMMSYAGLAVRQHQSGGPGSAPVVIGLPIDANHILKDMLLQAAFHVGTTAHPARRELGLSGGHPLRTYYQRLEQRGAHSHMGTAKKLLRVAAALVRGRSVYLPAEALRPQADGAMPAARLGEYLQAVRKMLIDKWKPYDLSGIPDEENQLELWLREIDRIVGFVNTQNK